MKAQLYNKKVIAFLIFLLPYLFGGYFHLNEYFPLIHEVFEFNDKLYFLVIDKNGIYIFEKFENKVSTYCFKKEEAGKEIVSYRLPEAEVNIDSLKKLVEIKNVFSGGYSLYFNLEKKCFENISKSKFKSEKRKKEYEFIIKDTLKIKLEKGRKNGEREDTFIIFTPSKKEKFPLPPLSLFSFKRLVPEHLKFHLKYESEREFGRYSVFLYEAKDLYLIGNKIWFLIDFYTGEGYEGAGGIGYFDYKRKKIGIARIPELNDYGIFTSFITDKNIWIVPIIHYEYHDKFADYLIEFNTTTYRYRVYTPENSLFKSFEIVKISKINKDLICFFTGTEVILLNLKTYEWEKYSLYLKVKTDSTPLFYIKSVSAQKRSPLIIKYAKKEEEFFPLDFMWNKRAEIKVPFKICGKCEVSREYIKDEKNKKKALMELFSVDYYYIKTKDKNILYFHFSPFEISKEIIKDSVYEICVYGAYIKVDDTELSLKTTGKIKIPPPPWKIFSQNPVFSMEEEVEIMKREAEESQKFLYPE